MKVRNVLCLTAVFVLAGTMAVQAALDQELERREEQKAIWLERVSNAKFVNCAEYRWMYSENKAFKRYVINSIVDFNRINPGHWINLDLSNDDLGGTDTEFLKELIDAIVTQVKDLNIDVASLNLANNKITTLPNHIFKDLANLQWLDLSHNQLTPLSDNIFNDLTHLQWLRLNDNHELRRKTSRELGLGDDAIIFWH